MGKATNPAKARQRVTAEAQQHGDYGRENGIDQNHGASPLVRWRAKGMINGGQEAAIAFVLRIWELIGTSTSLTASYGERVAASTHDNESGGMILMRMEAADDLARIKGYIPRAYWDVFENCIRHDEPAGVSGSRLGYGDRSAAVRAHLIVVFVADIICTRERLSY